jgi:hypothetical protein
MTVAVADGGESAEAVVGTLDHGVTVGFELGTRGVGVKS